MAHILIMEGNTLDRQRQATKLGVRSASEVYRQSVHAHFPDLEIDVVNAADRGETPPEGRSLQDYDGLIVGGSGLHAYDNDFAVTNQIEMLKTFAETGKPILGSCWGLQIAAIAAGGSVALSPNGREVVIARKVHKVGDGAHHPYLAGRPDVFDAPCIHYDEVTSLPSGSALLCSNHHSMVQGAIIPVGKSDVWAVQYHPEFDIEQLRMLVKLYAKNMVDQGFFEHDDERLAYEDKLAQLRDDPDNKALAWQLGFDSDITQDRSRRAEIMAWVENKILT